MPLGLLLDLPKIRSVTESNYPRCSPRETILHRPFLVTSIGVLLALRLPLAVIRLITFFVIYSSDGCPRWTRTHIRKKVLKYVPSLADFNSSTAIFFIARCIWIHATLTHRTPRYVLRRSGKSMAKRGHV